MAADIFSNTKGKRGKSGEFVTTKLSLLRNSSGNYFVHRNVFLLLVQKIYIS